MSHEACLEDFYLRDVFRSHLSFSKRNTDVEIIKHRPLSSWMSGSSDAKALLLASCGQGQVRIPPVHAKFTISSDYHRLQWSLYSLFDELGA